MTYARNSKYCNNVKKIRFINLEASIHYNTQVKWYLDMFQHRASTSFVVSRFKVSKVYAVLSKSAVSE